MHWIFTVFLFLILFVNCCSMQVSKLGIIQISQIIQQYVGWAANSKKQAGKEAEK
jgi:hypothetical protein